ncbi:MAG: hydrogenase maturation protease [Nitrospira sp.]|nr:hydrogenase maturation protease [Nitrospira sp.]
MAVIRIIGIGNLFRGDDAVGLLAARRLRQRLDSSVEVLEAEGDGLALLDLMEGADQVMLIDAVKSGGHPGTTVRLDLSKESRWGRLVPCSTHAIGIAEAIDLAGDRSRQDIGAIAEAGHAVRHRDRLPRIRRGPFGIGA